VLKIAKIAWEGNSSHNFEPDSSPHRCTNALSKNRASQIHIRLIFHAIVPTQRLALTHVRHPELRFLDEKGLNQFDTFS
jgi:hypothetical protein